MLEEEFLTEIQMRVERTAPDKIQEIRQLKAEQEPVEHSSGPISASSHAAAG